MTATRLHIKRVEKPWGRRDLWDGFDDVAEGGAPVGEIWFEVPGAPGPSDPAAPALLIKYLFTSDKLSVQVHPDDAQAQAAGQPRGKSESWVILDAEPHASIAIGTLGVMTKEELRAAAEDGSIEQKLDWKQVHKDDFYYTPANTVHAIGPGLTLIEVQQNSDITYRLYDYGSGRELHLDKGVECSDPVPYVAAARPYEVATGRTALVDGPIFALERWRDVAGTTLAPAADRPIWLIPVTGGGTLDGERFEAGQCWLVDGTAAIAADAGADLLLAYPGEGIVPDLVR